MSKLTVVYNSFGGRYSDSPRAIYSALRRRRQDGRHVWLSESAHAHSFPPDVEIAPRGAAWVDALESADVVVSNSYLDLEWRKRPDAVYLQSWHGTPLKRIHFDALWSRPGRLESLAPDIARWDYLVSPNARSTPVLRSAFGFVGDVLETGYPRNDVLHWTGRDRVRARVRRELGIPDGVTAVLYTPTWRDDVFYGDGGSVPLGLDVDDFVAHLGDDHCLLVRAHYLMADRLSGANHPQVRDVSGYPEISELYLAADVLVTDYSSTMFDFAVTGKPILFYAYDLAHYRDVVRGFYFELADHAPGPLVTTTSQLIEALRDLPALRGAFADRYAQFREEFCHLDDGHATERVLARLFPEAARRAERPARRRAMGRQPAVRQFDGPVHGEAGPVAAVGSSTE